MKDVNSVEGRVEYSRMRKQVDDAKRVNREKFEASSKKRLTTNVKKKFDTTMIGALARFEEYFGALWGMGLDEHELNPEEQIWRERWELVRKEVLDNGNNNLRAALDEIAQYTMTWDRYRTEFVVKTEHDSIYDR